MRLSQQTDSEIAEGTRVRSHHCDFGGERGNYGTRESVLLEVPVQKQVSFGGSFEASVRLTMIQCLKRELYIWRPMSA
jgi:hypothetical protein